jgi:hypothetical protein
MPMEPCGSNSWIAFAAASAVIPPPTIKYRYCFILIPFKAYQTFDYENAGAKKRLTKIHFLF